LVDGYIFLIEENIFLWIRLWRGLQQLCGGKQVNMEKLGALARVNNFFFQFWYLEFVLIEF
jgi:hypothetical protein